ncbi:MAG: hypothetical protein A3K59_00260 [Euryarchaeota archaeon RBG_19FT_COMBO_69_17]|nr:MAG: hypothetical protein A3K59_00260 [Euryarchaeota archaeon RBG_19FT_COMBO_69_17]
MPPHCDTLDGPVVVAARKALEMEDVKIVLPFAPKAAEGEIRQAFERTLKARELGKEAKEVADLWFFETVVRLHRAGESAPYTGLKPAGLDWGPVLPRADRAIEKGRPDEVVEFMTHALEHSIRTKFEQAMDLKSYRKGDVDAARAYTSAMLGFELFTHHLYASIVGDGGHRAEAEGGERHEH